MGEQSVGETKPCRWGCDGSGKIRIGESSDRFCTCLIVRRIRDILGTDLCDPKMVPIAASPLFAVDGSVDKTRENLILRGAGDRFDVPHLRFALSSKLRLTGFRFRYQLIDDERLKNVWVGNESHKNKPKSKRGEDNTINALRDLCGEDYDLVIIRLGILTAKNVEAARILHETLLIRDSMRKPTWLVEKPGRPFDLDYMTYNDSVWDHIVRQFTLVELMHDATYVPPAPTAYEDDEGASFGTPALATVAAPPQPQPQPAVRPAARPARPPAQVQVPSELSLPGALEDKGYKNGYKGGRR